MLCYVAIARMACFLPGTSQVRGIVVEHEVTTRARAMHHDVCTAVLSPLRSAA